MDTPVEVAVPLLISLLDEIKEAQTGQYKKLREKYGFDYYLLVTLAQKWKEADEVQDTQTFRTGKNHAEDLVTWLKVEEEAFARCAVAHFEFDLPSPRQPHVPDADADADADANGEVVGKVLLVKADQIEAVRQSALEMATTVSDTGE